VESMMQNDLPLSIYRGIKSHRACWQPTTTLVNASTMFAMEHICSPSLAAKLFIRRQNTFGGKFCLCQPPYLSGTGGLFYSEMRLTRNQLATVAGAFDAQTAIDCLEFEMVEINGGISKMKQAKIGITEITKRWSLWMPCMCCYRSIWPSRVLHRKPSKQRHLRVEIISSRSIK
jgi:hypothetical protein